MLTRAQLPQEKLQSDELDEQRGKPLLHWVLFYFRTLKFSIRVQYRMVIYLRFLMPGTVIQVLGEYMLAVYFGFFGLM